MRGERNDREKLDTHREIEKRRRILESVSMSCSVAIASSPAFSPSRIPLSCKTATSPETLTLVLTPRHHHHHHLPAAGCERSPSPTPCSSSSSSPFRSRFQRPVSGLRASSVESPSSPSSLSPPRSISSGGSSLLKRKRPARIDIPMAEAAALAFGPAGSDGRREVEAESVRFSVYCKRGKKRLEMEDRHKAVLDLHGDSQMAFFGIFDGHGGTRASEFASENMGELIVDEVVTRGEACSEIEEAVRTGYLKTDAEFLKQDVSGGTCCVTALLRRGDLVVSNVGDCRAVLSRAGKAEALTSDHRPSREDEKTRIESLGGYVDYCRGTWRLQGCLAVSRGIGDSHLKEWVIPEPETTTLKIMPDCEFLILASDGLWDKISNQEAVDVARPLCIDADKPSPLSACKKLADLSATRGSVDDISVMIIQLRHFV